MGEYANLFYGLGWAYILNEIKSCNFELITKIIVKKKKMSINIEIYFSSLLAHCWTHFTALSGPKKWILVRGLQRWCMIPTRLLLLFFLSTLFWQAKIRRFFNSALLALADALRSVFFVGDIIITMM